jgi:hypothetical protein
LAIHRSEKLVDRGHYRATVAKPLADEIVQPGQTAYLAAHGADRPYPSGALAAGQPQIRGCPAHPPIRLPRGAVG